MSASVTQRDVRSAVEELGMAGTPVCVHASLRSFGWVDGGALSIVKGLLAAQCTVLVPTFTSFNVPPPEDPRLRPKRNGWDYGSISQNLPGDGRVFTPESMDLDREDMGAVSAAVLAMSGRVRGNHPLNSFTAVGPLAHDLIDGQQPTDVYRPLEILVSQAGWVLLMGTTLRSLTLLHLAEKVSGRRLFQRWAIDPIGKVIVAEVGSCSRGFDSFEPTVVELERRIIVGQSTWKAYPAKALLERATQAICINPFITHCGNAQCNRCRDAVVGGPMVSGP